MFDVSRSCLLIVSICAMSVPSLRAAEEWRIHDRGRPRPAVIQPGSNVGAPPSDAIVLFDGSDLSAWNANDGSAAKWHAENGYIEVEPGTGPMRTRQGFGDCQLHVEWATPPPSGNGQGRGNSGLYFMRQYEVQILDSYDNDTYPDGQAGAVYAQQPPLVNASRAPGEWQAYDIIFRRPRFAPDGSVASPARVTVFHNGVLVQDDTLFTGPTSWMSRPAYAAHADALPLELQDHGNRMRFRNIWLRELPEPVPQAIRPDLSSAPVSSPTADDIERFTGHFQGRGGFTVIVRAENSRLGFFLGEQFITRLRHESENRWVGESVDIELVYQDERSVAFTIGMSTQTLVRLTRIGRLRGQPVAGARQ
jgi:hypothetical protein